MLRRLGTSGLTVVGAGLLGAVSGHQAASAQVDGYADDVRDPSADGQHSNGQHSNGEHSNGEHSYDDGTEVGRMSAESPVGVAAGPYGGDFAPPEDLDADSLDHLTYPPPPVKVRTSRTIDVEMSVVEVEHAISRTRGITAWSYTSADGASSPGPILRANEGDLLRIHFTNRTGHDHNLHFHGRHSPLHDGWEPIPPGGETVYEITAGPAGIHPYHCHTMPIDHHIAKGLYGALIVDAPGGLPVTGSDPDAVEVVLALSGWDVDEDGRNEFYTWNGVAGFFSKFPIKVPAGQPVRAHVFNMVEFDPLASFHLHAEMFDVYPTGMSGREAGVPALTSDIITLGQMERATVEFTLPERGRYMFHPHQHSMASRGAMGWFAAI